MAENSRIEDLRKRYHENPRRFFAPLANEYRKAGFLDRALLLCHKHVPEQPDNMNGLVVFGQTLFESGNTAEAQEPFERTLKLDPENLIALRHLGDIARIGGDVAAAKQWYERVLELDRRNDDVLDLLQQMGFGDTTEEQPAAPPSTMGGGLVSVASSVSMSGAQDTGMIDLDAPAEAAPAQRTMVIDAQALADRDRRDADVIADPPSARPKKRASLLDIDFDFSETAAAPEAPTVPSASAMGAEATEYGFVIETTGDVEPLGLEPTIAEAVSAPTPSLPADDFELADYSAEVSPLAGLEATEFTSEAVAPLAELENDIVDLPLLEEPEPASAALLEPPSARPKPRMTKADLSSLPLLADFGLDDEEPASSKLTPILTPAVIAAMPPSAAEPPSLELPSVESASAAALRPAKATPTFVTETMAALYVQQGHLSEAIGVYRQLVAQSPNDSGLRAKLAELERMQQAEQTAAMTAMDSEMPEFDEPVNGSEPEPAASNSALADVSFGDIGLQGQGSPTPVLTPAVASGPSAREFFGGFARRAVVAAAVVAAAVVTESAEVHAAEPDAAVSSGVSSWPLDALFGAAQEVRDLHAAEVLAGVGTFAGPDGGTGFDALFAEQSQPARRAVPRASEMLKFDQFFQTPGSAMAGGAPAPAPDVLPAVPGDDDLGQFQGWLKGLKK